MIRAFSILLLLFTPKVYSQRLVTEIDSGALAIEAIAWIDPAGTLFAMGNNFGNSLGIEGGDRVDTPMRVSGGDDVQGVKILQGRGTLALVFLKTDGSLWTTNPDYGILGGSALLLNRNVINFSVMNRERYNEGHVAYLTATGELYFVGHTVIDGRTAVRTKLITDGVTKQLNLFDVVYRGERGLASKPNIFANQGVAFVRDGHIWLGFASWPENEFVFEKTPWPWQDRFRDAYIISAGSFDGNSRNFFALSNRINSDGETENSLIHGRINSDSVVEDWPLAEELEQFDHNGNFDSLYRDGFGEFRTDIISHGFPYGTIQEGQLTVQWTEIDQVSKVSNTVVLREDGSIWQSRGNGWQQIVEPGAGKVDIEHHPGPGRQDVILAFGYPCPGRPFLDALNEPQWLLDTEETTTALSFAEQKQIEIRDAINLTYKGFDVYARIGAPDPTLPTVYFIENDSVTGKANNIWHGNPQNKYRIAYCMTPAGKESIVVANLAAHEIGHLLGLAHCAFDPEEPDVMAYACSHHDLARRFFYNKKRPRVVSYAWNGDLPGCWHETAEEDGQTTNTAFYLRRWVQGFDKDDIDGEEGGYDRGLFRRAFFSTARLPLDFHNLQIFRGTDCTRVIVAQRDSVPANTPVQVTGSEGDRLELWGSVSPGDPPQLLFVETMGQSGGAGFVEHTVADPEPVTFIANEDGFFQFKTQPGIQYEILSSTTLEDYSTARLFEGTGAWFQFPTNGQRGFFRVQSRWQP